MYFVMVYIENYGIYKEYLTIKKASKNIKQKYKIVYITTNILKK